MVGAETSDTSCRRFPDMEERLAGRHHLESGQSIRLQVQSVCLQQRRVHGPTAVFMLRWAMGKMSHGAH